MKTNIEIYSMKLAGFLMTQGFVIQDIVWNKVYRDKKMFLFRDSETIKTYIEYYNNNNVKKIHL